MESPHRWILHALCLSAALLCFASPEVAHADELAGRLTDAATGVPVEGATIRVLGTAEVARTDEDGYYAFDVPQGTYELAIEANIGGETFRSRHVNQRVPQRRLSRPHVYTRYFLEQGHEPLEHAVGLPSFSGRAPAEGPDSIDISDLFEAVTSPLALTIPSNTPTMIRVGRRQDHTGAQGCTDSSNPIVGIDEMHLDEYVKGVLPPEIGVFRSISGASEVYKTFAIAAKSYALWFMLYYDSGNRRTLNRTVDGFNWFHIDDTACNQRYSDDRLTITTNAAEAVQNKILVRASDSNNLEKYEYAASCGRHGTRPEHQTALVSDVPPQNACAGSWCGHDSCAAHEDNPNVAGSDRCLVRGICQWGAASWGKSGKSYTWMLDHYQPNLQVRDLTPSGPATVVLTGYAYTNPDDIAGSGVEGVAIELSDGQTTTTGADGTYRFDQVRVDLGAVDITARKAGYEDATRTKELEAGVTNWGSVLLVESSSDGGEDTGTSDAGTVADAGSSDAGSSDAGSSDAGASDTGSGESDAAGASDAASTPDSDGSGALGQGNPLVQPSKGVNGGCSTTGSSPLSASLILLALAVLVGVRRRTERLQA